MKGGGERRGNVSDGVKIKRPTTTTMGWDEEGSG
jgi:hypothetical protein